MLPAAYRMWSKTRLRHVQPWVAEWSLEDMYAGIEGRGAQEAAYNTAVMTEWARLRGMDFVGGAADIYKCFDQLLRPLINRVLEEGGMPARIRKACIGYLEGLRTRNTVAGGLGEEYS